MYDEPMHEGRQLPMFTLREIDLPELKQWQIGNKYYLVVAVELVGKREIKYSLPEGSPTSDGVKIDGEFKMVSVDLLPDKEANTAEKQAFERTVAKAKSGSL